MTRIFVGPDAGIELLRQAAALDPLSSSAHRMLGLRCFLAGRLDEATAALKTSLDLNPKAGLVHCFLCATNLAQGRATEALELAERESLPDFRLLGIALAQHALGRKEEADAAMAQLIERYGNTAAYQIAEAHAWRGEHDRVFEWLERAYTQRDPGLSITLTDSFFRPVRDDPRGGFSEKVGSLLGWLRAGASLALGWRCFGRRFFLRRMRWVAQPLRKLGQRMEDDRLLRQCLPCHAAMASPPSRR